MHDSRPVSSELGSLGFKVLLGCSRGTCTMIAPAREMHRKDHTSKEEKMQQHNCLPMQSSHAGAERKKVQSDLRQRFITLAWPEWLSRKRARGGACRESLEGVHANMPKFALRKATSALSYLGGRLAPMVTVAPEPFASRGTCFVAAFS